MVPGAQRFSGRMPPLGRTGLFRAPTWSDGSDSGETADLDCSANFEYGFGLGALLMAAVFMESGTANAEPQSI